MVLRYSAATAARKDINPERDVNQPIWAHPVVRYYWADWRLIRDCIEGEREVKDGRESYLPALDGMETGEYESYLDRSTFYNFTGRTLSALVGTLFRRKFKIIDLPSELSGRIEKISRSGASFTTFAETAAEEFMALGRFGALVDLPAIPSAEPKPYIVPYVAENILDWDTGVVDPETGHEVLTYLVLREWKRVAPSANATRRYVATYRVLTMEPLNEAKDGQEASGPMVYVQKLYVGSATADATLEGEYTRTVPLIRGEPLKEIPFYCFEAQRPPMLDIARLNISHFRSYAHLEHGRFYTALPVYYAEVAQAGGNNYYIGPSVVWELQQGCKAGLLEYNGGGLGTLVTALNMKEAQAASLGGRMIGVTTQSTAETDNQTALKDRNEQALLHRTARLLDEGFTQILRWLANFANAPESTVRVVFNKSFLYDAIGSREFRAMQSMYKDGILPIEVVHDYMIKAGVIDDEIDLEDFTKMLESEDQFPNQPDFKARKEGYPNAQAKVSAELKETDLDLGQQELDLTEKEMEQAAAEAEKARKTAEKIAKQTPKVEPGVAAQRMQGREAGPPPPPGTPTAPRPKPKPPA